jgi:broad specificity phosphatase PhoE
VTTELFLVRHGETDWNTQRRIQGLTDIPLNARGREQARRTGRMLARRGWDGIYSSPLGRARETARIIAAEVGLGDPGIVEALVERNYGEAEGMNFDEIEARWPDRGTVPGQESRREVTERVVPALRRLAASHPDQSLIVVSHGGAIRAVLSAADPDGVHGMISNGSIHSFRLGDDDVLRLVEFDDPISLDPLDAQNAVEARDDEGAA